MNYKLVRHGKFSTEELNSLYKLFEEEERVNTEEKLRVYAQKNKFKIEDIGSVTTKNFEFMVNNYDFMVTTDKHKNIIGYICFEQIEISKKNVEQSTTVFDIVHMYIPNAQNHTRIDYVMFSLIENIVEKCIIYSKTPYRYFHSLNGYIPIKALFSSNCNGYIKFKNEFKLPYVNHDFRQTLYTIYTIVKNTGNLE